MWKYLFVHIENLMVDQQDQDSDLNDFQWVCVQGDPQVAACNIVHLISGIVF
jgi:hypothetical protein